MLTLISQVQSSTLPIRRLTKMSVAKCIIYPSLCGARKGEHSWTEKNVTRDQREMPSVCYILLYYYNGEEAWSGPDHTTARILHDGPGGAGWRAAAERETKSCRCLEEPQTIVSHVRRGQG